VVVKVRAGVVMIIVKDWGADGPVVSVTVTLKENGPASVGVPEITPVGERVRPSGKPPLVTVHVHEPVHGVDVREA
jgi:hypothetical protein